MSLFYLPKLKLANDLLNFNLTQINQPLEPMSSNSIVTYIIWGLQPHDTSVNAALEPLFATHRPRDVYLLDQLLEREMENNALENFQLMYQFCQSLYTKTVNNEFLKQVNCFDKYFKHDLFQLTASTTSDSGVQLSQSSMKMYQNYCDPLINPTPIENFISNLNRNFKKSSQDQSLFRDCIKWWSYKFFTKTQDSPNSPKKLFYGPLFLVNRVVPSVYLIRVDTNLPMSRNFEQMQDNFKKYFSCFFFPFKDNEGTQ